MNAAAQRRLTSVLVAAMAVLGAVLLSLWFGAGRGISWDRPRPLPPLPTMRAVMLPTPVPLQSLAQSWEHPLFSADRKPILTQSGGSEGVSLGDLQLTGIILTPHWHMALLGPVNDTKDKEGQQVSVREGAHLPDTNWKLVQVLSRSAVFVSPSGRTELKLPAGAPITQPSAPDQRNHPQRPSDHDGLMPESAPTGSPGYEQAERLQKPRATIIKQRSPQSSGNQRDH